MSDVIVVASQIVKFLIEPFNLLVILLLLVYGLLVFNKLFLAKNIIISLLIIIGLISFSPFANWLLWTLEEKYPPYEDSMDIDGIIVLSGAEKAFNSLIWNQPVLNSASERDFAFIALSKKYRNAKLVFTGGNSSLDKKEYQPSDVARQLFSMHGVDVSRVFFENESRNTWESILNTRKMIKLEKDENWVVITSAWHMERTMKFLCKAGWKNVIPYPVDYRSVPLTYWKAGWSFSGNMIKIKLAVKEWLGLYFYQLTGRAC
jgi:uncharacterized SAM-binding protein YcdF (DUF218 family)